MIIKQRSSSLPAASLSTFPAILQRIYASRGITDITQLDKRLQALHPFNTLSNISLAVDRLAKALKTQEKILIVGDFDADGATSTALAVSALRAMGASCVEFLVPNRFAFGYGLTPAIVDVALLWHPQLIVTVDNGIASVEGVAHANVAGIDVIVTDHHLPAEVMPDACAIVNPNQNGCNFPSKAIAGVGVIFYVMLALRRHLETIGWFSEQGIDVLNMSQFLDLVALGTVADVVALDQNNRILVNQGLVRMREGLCRPGIKALLEVAGKTCAQLRENDLGFSIAPRLNAAGRLDDMSLGIECLLSDTIEKARALAEQLDSLNIERRKIESEMSDQALDALRALSLNMTAGTSLPISLCLMDEAWHQGVIGILAGRLKEKFHRPTIAFAKVSDTELKGSARSVPGLNIRDVLAAVDKDNPGIIMRFGGHAMAAGLSIAVQHFTEFQQAFNIEVSKHLDIAQCLDELQSDGALTPADLTIEFATLLKYAGPWGQHFPEPVFDNIFEILEQRIVGQQHLKLTFVHESGGAPIDAIFFQVDLKKWPNYRARFVRVAYRLEINEFRGKKRPQLMVLSQDVVGE